MSAGSIFLDCCRDTADFMAIAPSKPRTAAGGTRSLRWARSHATSATRDPLLNFATAPGPCALDRSSRLPGFISFTDALLKALAAPRRLLELNPFAEP